MYIPFGGSRLNTAESIQRILFQLGLAGQYWETPIDIISSLEAVAQVWKQDPTTFE